MSGLSRPAAPCRTSSSTGFFYLHFDLGAVVEGVSTISSPQNIQAIAELADQALLR